jgi:hypothetical protein
MRVATRKKRRFLPGYDRLESTAPVSTLVPGLSVAAPSSRGG